MFNMYEYVVGIDIGGTKISGGLVDQNGNVSHFQVGSTPQGAEAILEAVAEIIQRLIDTGHPVKGIGIGAAGQVDVQNGTITHAVDTLPGWKGTPVAEWLRARFPMPVIVDNDVNAMALGEMRFGAGRGLKSALYVAVGTGIGGAMVIGEELWRGSHWSAGELGHLVVDWRGTRLCTCGQTGHLEGYVAGPAVARAYYERRGLPLSNDLRPVVEAAAKGDSIAQAVLHESAEILGKTLAGMVSAFDPQALIIGGGAAYGSGGLWWNTFEQTMRSSTMPAPQKVELRLAELREHAVMIGAACLAWEKEEQS
jgi:glucokinase